jgi:hypothetical protein
VLWEDKKLVKEMAEGDGRRSGIPVLFQIPADCTATDDGRNISWKLNARADVPGVDFETAFEVPVFQVSSSQSKAVNAAEFAARYEEPMDFAKALDANGVKIRSDGNETELVFAAARHKTGAIILTLITLAALAASSVVFKPGASFVGVIIWALITLLSAYLTISLWTSRSRVRAGSDRLEITRRWLFMSSRKLLHAGEVETIKTHLGMTSGETNHYYVMAMLPGGKTVKLGQLIQGQHEAEWVAAQIRRALHGK